MKSNEEFVKFLGEGEYGSVDLVKYTQRDGSSFHAAVKSSADYNSLNKELRILRELRGCPRIVECLGDCLEEGLACNGDKIYRLLLEYASEGTLSDFMGNYTTDRKLPDPMIRDFTRMILQGLVSIHGHGYVHCDLKPSNILVFPCGDHSYELKISDFGLSLKVGEIPDYWANDFPFVGAPIYMPPESLCDGVAEKTLDLWSLGCLVLEMYTGESPWRGVKNIDLQVLLLDGKVPVIPESVPCDAREFIETCFARKPKERGSADELLSLRFLPREEEKTEKINIAVVTAGEERRNSSLLNLKSSNIRQDSKKSMDTLEKPTQLKKLLGIVMRLKMIKFW